MSRRIVSYFYLLATLVLSAVNLDPVHAHDVMDFPPGFGPPGIVRKVIPLVTRQLGPGSGSRSRFQAANTFTFGGLFNHDDEDDDSDEDESRGGRSVRAAGRHNRIGAARAKRLRSSANNGDSIKTDPVKPDFRIRSAPGTNSAVMALARHARDIKLTGGRKRTNSGNWVQVRFNQNGRTRTGWVSAAGMTKKIAERRATASPTPAPLSTPPPARASPAPVASATSPFPPPAPGTVRAVSRTPLTNSSGPVTPRGSIAAPVRTPPPVHGNETSEGADRSAAETEAEHDRVSPPAKLQPAAPLAAAATPPPAAPPPQTAPTAQEPAPLETEADQGAAEKHPEIDASAPAGEEAPSPSPPPHPAVPPSPPPPVAAATPPPEPPAPHEPPKAPRAEPKEETKTSEGAGGKVECARNNAEIRRSPLLSRLLGANYNPHVVWTGVHSSIKPEGDHMVVVVDTNNKEVQIGMMLGMVKKNKLRTVLPNVEICADRDERKAYIVTGKESDKLYLQDNGNVVTFAEKEGGKTYKETYHRDTSQDTEAQK